MNTRQKAHSFECRDDGGKMYIEGYFARFDDVYDMGYGVYETIGPHAFDESIAGDDIRVLINHDTSLVLGRTAAGTASLKVDAVGLWGSVEINPNDQEAVNAHARVMRGDVNQASFGFDIIEISRRFMEDGSIYRKLDKVKLYEISVCTFPAYEGTELTARSADDVKTASAEISEWRKTMKERVEKWHSGR